MEMLEVLKSIARDDTVSASDRVEAAKIVLQYEESQRQFALHSAAQLAYQGGSVGNTPINDLGH